MKRLLILLLLPCAVTAQESPNPASAVEASSGGMDTVTKVVGAGAITAIALCATGVICHGSGNAVSGTVNNGGSTTGTK